MPLPAAEVSPVPSHPGLEGQLCPSQMGAMPGMPHSSLLGHRVGTNPVRLLFAGDVHSAK